MAIDDPHGRLYVVDRDPPTITAIDITTFAVLQTYPLKTKCPTTPAMAGALIWFAFSCGTTKHPGGFAVLHPATGKTDVFPIDGATFNGPGPGIAVDHARHRLFFISPGGYQSELQEYDIGSGRPALLQSTTLADRLDSATVSPDGSLVYLGGYEALLIGLRTSDLSQAFRYGNGDSRPALTSDGAFLAVAHDELFVPGEPNVFVVDGHTSGPVVQLSAGTQNSDYIPEDSVAFGPDDQTLYALTVGGPQAELTVFSHATIAHTWLSLTTPPFGQVDDPQVLSGDLQFSDDAPPEAQTVTTVCTDPSGGQQTFTKSPHHDGSYEITYRSTAQEGTYTCVASFTGDSRHESAQATATFLVQKRFARLTLQADKGEVVTGTNVTLTAHLDATGSGNRTVTITRTDYLGNQFPQSGTIDDAGNLSFTYALDRTSSFVATWDGDDEWNAAQSITVRVYVDPILSAALAGDYGMDGRYHLYHYRASCPAARHTGCPRDNVSVVPDETGQYVYFDWQVHQAGAWRSVFYHGVKLGPGSAIQLIMVYGGTAIKGVPQRVSVEFEGRDGLETVQGPYLYFKVTS
jgi:hypothetical protein